MQERSSRKLKSAEVNNFSCFFGFLLSYNHHMSFQITEETYKEYNFENVIWWEHAPSSSCHFRNIFFILRVIEENTFLDY